MPFDTTILGKDCIISSEADLGVNQKTLTSAHSLAALLARLGQKERAIRIAEEVLTLRKEVLGENHPETLAALYDLACCQRRLRRHGIAALMFNNCHKLRNDVLGNHPDTLRALRSEAGSWGRAGKRNVQRLCWEMLFLSLYDRFLAWLIWLAEKRNKKPREKPMQPQRLAS